MKAALKGIKWRLDALGEGLRKATSCADGTSVGERNSGCAALAAVVDFLESVPDFRKEGLSKPLESVVRELTKVAQGHASPMFEPDPQGHRKKDHIFKEYLVGHASATMEFWIRSGLKKRRAAGLVADTLARAGFRLPGGRPLSWRTIDGWRNRVIGRADLNLATRTYRRAKDEAESTQLPWQILAERALCVLEELVRHQNLEKPPS